MPAVLFQKKVSDNFIGQVDSKSISSNLYFLLHIKQCNSLGISAFREGHAYYSRQKQNNS